MQSHVTKSLHKKIAHVKIDEQFNNAKGQALVEMGLAGFIYKLANVGTAALVDWILNDFGPKAGERGEEIYQD